MIPRSNDPAPGSPGPSGRVAAGRAYDELRRLRGKVRLGIDLEALREDR